MADSNAACCSSAGKSDKRPLLQGI